MRRVIVAGLLAAAGAAVLFAAAPLAEAQSGGATVTVTGPSGTIESDGEPVAFRIGVDGVSNLGAFEFVLTFDSNLFGFDRAEPGDFLGSTGREVVCDEARSAPGAVRMLCVTLLREPDGPAGAGTLATVWLRPKGAGKSDIILSRYKLTSVTAAELAGQSRGTVVAVGGDGSDVWLIVTAALSAGLLVLAAASAISARLRRRGSAPSADAAP